MRSGIFSRVVTINHCFAFLHSPFKILPLRIAGVERISRTPGKSGPVYFVSRRKTVISKSKFALNAAIAAASIASPESAESIRGWGTLLFTMARRFYDARMEQAQMRFAPTRRAGGRHCCADLG
jgi:hypothetical protein